MRLSMTLMGGVCAAALLAGCADIEAAPNGNSLAARHAAGAYTPTTEADMKTPDMRKFRGKELDLSGYHMTFKDDFNKMSVTDEAGNGPWYAPGHDDFGASHFVAPRQGKGPIFVRDGKLVMQVMKEDGKWLGSMAQTMNKEGQGFAQQYGYFETRAKMSDGKAAWGGIWLHSHPSLTGPNMPQTEIDTAEIYGGDLRGHHAAVHIWPAATPEAGAPTHVIGTGAYTKIDGIFDGYHTYGTLVTPDYVVFYFDRKEVTRMPTRPEFKTPLYMMIDLTLLPKFSGWATDTMEMDVDYVHVWQKSDGFKSPDKN